ncbi:MAG TPA: hypothetical protein VK601_27565, partial [Kofleriaceae bacterium]|nr:hypothetical protein [Kofleriaceae bacterium]
MLPAIHDAASRARAPRVAPRTGDTAGVAPEIASAQRPAAGHRRAHAAPVNDPEVDEWSPSIAASGNLYFGAGRPGGHGGSDLWVARWVGGAYQPPENLGDAINTAGSEVEPWIAPDESYLIF